MYIMGCRGGSVEVWLIYAANGGVCGHCIFGLVFDRPVNNIHAPRVQLCHSFGVCDYVEVVKSNSLSHLFAMQ